MIAGTEVFASSLHARWIGTLRDGQIWHLGDYAEHTLCGRSFRDRAKPVDRLDVYDSDWLCARCLHSDRKRWQ